jgi:hypothetical protein
MAENGGLVKTNSKVGQTIGSCRLSGRPRGQRLVSLSIRSRKMALIRLICPWPFDFSQRTAPGGKNATRKTEGRRFGLY